MSGAHRLLVIAMLVCAAPRLAAARGDARTLWIRNVHTGVEYLGAPFARAGVVRRSDWLRLTRLFGDARVGAERAVHPRLLRTLGHVQQHFGGARIDLYSGYRVPGDGAERNSYHQVAHAADIRIPGVPARELFEYCRRALPRVGCGLYPNADFVHIDVRGSSAIWIDLGAADYVADPARWVAEHPAVEERSASAAPRRRSRRRPRRRTRALVAGGTPPGRRRRPAARRDPSSALGHCGVCARRPAVARERSRLANTWVDRCGACLARHAEPLVFFFVAIAAAGGLSTVTSELAELAAHDGRHYLRWPAIARAYQAAIDRRREIP